jgi:hypothetical protein
MIAPAVPEMIFDAPLGLVQLGSWWLLLVTVAFWFALCVVLLYRNNFHLSPYFKYQPWIVAPCWIVAIILHLQFSGWGFTPYLTPLFGDWGLQYQTLWGYNLYNVNPAGAQAGYNLMYVMHAVAGALFMSTFLMITEELSLGWELFIGSMGALSIQTIWEMTEYWSGVQQLASSPAEMLLRVQHASFTTGAALFAIALVAVVFVLIERYT